MGKKKHWLLHSQISGTVWFAVVLIAVLALVFFFFPQHRGTSEQGSKEQKNIVELQKKEDSVYQSRRQKSPSRERHSSHRQYSFQNRERRQDSPCILSDDFYTTAPTALTRQPLSVELNGADSTTLQLLHGIGPAYARRIVRYRERLGGFVSTDQLLEVYGFTPELLDHIRPHLTLDTGNLRKINVNTLALKQLIKHPYMDYYFARDLVNLRSRGVTFSSPDDLRAVPSCSDTLLMRLLPYLEF